MKSYFISKLKPFLIDKSDYNNLLTTLVRKRIISVIISEPISMSDLMHEMLL